MEIDGFVDKIGYWLVIGWCGYFDWYFGRLDEDEYCCVGWGGDDIGLGLVELIEMLLGPDLICLLHFYWNLELILTG